MQCDTPCGCWKFYTSSTCTLCQYWWRIQTWWNLYLIYKLCFITFITLVHSIHKPYPCRIKRTHTKTHTLQLFFLCNVNLENRSLNFFLCLSDKERSCAYEVLSILFNYACNRESDDRFLLSWCWRSRNPYSTINTIFRGNLNEKVFFFDTLLHEQPLFPDMWNLLYSATQQRE